ncbi:hypothetical protein GWK36_09025 [Caldichromatium japonicum]|uniref:Uncharacterized protein n=1 Tax=Caldichromatium japonicum TaxID=2699430 RepID=A0A6G7VDY8_9GAMM|nr:hypothetical protein [Caldichromatium japonicum]QIK38105.1 hypothetical protein GWK36_09025 [Caldichromatium japonicum]
MPSKQATSFLAAEAEALCRELEAAILRLLERADETMNDRAKLLLAAVNALFVARQIAKTLKGA